MTANLHATWTYDELCGMLLVPFLAGGLSAREQQRRQRVARVLWLRFGGGGQPPQTWAACGAAIGVQRARARQLAQYGLRLLRQPLRRQVLGLDRCLQSWPALCQAVYGTELG
jgi:hypothetical protein